MLNCRLLAVSLLVASCSPSREAPQHNSFGEARAFVTASLKDPDSARFGDFAPGKGTSICGWVNAKNGYGGYTGMQPFVYSPADPPADRLYIYDGSGDWSDKGIMAEIFEERGCTIGADHAKALNVRRLLRESYERLAEPTENVAQ